MTAQYASADGIYIERTGEIEPLTPRLEQYIVEALAGRSLDEIHSHEARRIDYVCLDGKLAIEIKTLEGDPTDRLNNLTEEFRRRSDWPAFFGSAPMESFLKNTEDPEGLRKKVIDRVGRAIFTHLRKANKQLHAHSEDFPEPKSARMVLLVNEDHASYDPHTVGYILFNALRRKENGEYIFNYIDGVAFLTERHGQVIDGRMAFPVMMVEGPSIGRDPWKSEVLQQFLRGWPAWNDVPLHIVDPKDANSSVIDPIAKSGTVQELWHIEYRRNPYLRSMSYERLHDRFDEISLQVMLETLKSSPLRLGHDALMMLMEMWSHMLLEINQRGIPITNFNPTAEREIAAAYRLNLRPNVVRWVMDIQRQRGIRE